MIENSIKTIHQFLKDAETYYLATVANGEQPRVRPFGTVLLYEGKIYILTATNKDVSKQLEQNSKFEITAMDKKGRWIRTSGNLIQDNRVSVHKAMLDEYPHLRNVYKEGDSNTNSLYMQIVKAVIYSFEDAPIELD